MTPIEPSHSFRLRHKPEAEQLGLAVDAKWLRVSLDYALSQIGFQGASEDELKGINRFVAVLLTQHEEPKLPQKLPDKSLLKSYEPETT